LLDIALRTMPADISIVDAQDRVVYYSDSPHRVFPRSPAIIGRTVQNCHPQKSVATVNRILEAFRKGERDSARFWLEMGGRFILIEYHALRNDSGRYLGTLEVSQDLTEYRALQGQKRLLDWE
ncbi:MAG: PAS domain-containing protein, partial [Spirochaetales bacterium]|nr:PAS domain-containing protein [Spirochaetales bacterium]